MNLDKLIVIGKIIKAHGVRGNFIVKSFTSNIDDITIYPIYNIEGDKQNIEFKNKIGKKDCFLCSSEILASKEQINSLENKYLYTKNSYIQENKQINNDNEFLINDLIGKQIFDKNQKLIAVVTDVLNYGASDIISITYIDSDKNDLIPFLDEYFDCSDLDMIILKKKFI